MCILTLKLYRSKPINKFSWGLDSVMSVKFNPIEKDILCSTATDRSVALYDLRGKTPVRKLIMAVNYFNSCLNLLY